MKTYILYVPHKPNKIEQCAILNRFETINSSIELILNRAISSHHNCFYLRIPDHTLINCGWSQDKYTRHDVVECNIAESIGDIDDDSLDIIRIELKDIC